MKLKAVRCLVVCISVFFILFGCSSKKEKDNDLIHFNVSISYPEKEIKLEDVADIEYLQLGVFEEFLFSESPTTITSDKIIFNSFSTGDIIIYSRAGKPLSKFNRRGNGPEEYINTTGSPIYDETSDEFFIPLHQKIMVYSSSGEFKRSFPLPDGSFLFRFNNYDSKSFLIYDSQDILPATFTLISKEDGSVLETIKMSIGETLNLTVPISISEGFNLSLHPEIGNVVNYKDGFLLAIPSNDTMYYFSPQKELLPILVRNPNIHSMNPAITVSCFVEAGNYAFMFTDKVVEVKMENGRVPSLPRTYLMRDKTTGSVYKQKIALNDYKGKEVNISHRTIMNTQDSKLGLIVLGLTELQDANLENKLSGRLKELVDNSDDDGNDIYMLLHFK